MEQENTETQEQVTREEATTLDEMSVEDSFNLVVNLARNTKLSYKEHMIVSKAIKTVLGALNENLD
jgi:hypothetical protein